MSRKRIALVSTGGTIEKTYDELEGVLEAARGEAASATEPVPDSAMVSS